MKLLIFIHSLSSGGAERVTVNLANYWAGKGWDITIVTMSGMEDDFYVLHQDIRRVALELGTESANMFAAIKNNLRRVHALRAVLRREKPDVALSMMVTANCLLALAAWGTSIPAIGSERAHPPRNIIGKTWEWMRRFSYPKLSAVVAQTEKSAEWIREKTGAVVVPVIPNPVAYPLVHREPIVTPEPIGDSTSVGHLLLAVGRLVPQKGFAQLVDVFGRLAKVHPDWSLVILGDGSERAALEARIRSGGLAARIRLPGLVGNMGHWYEAADLYVMTSHFEGFPNTLVEAMAHGLPVVSFDCDTGPRDIIRHELDGFLVPMGDVDALQQALAQLMDDEILRDRFGKCAVEVGERFSMRKIAGIWENLLEEIMA